MTPQSLQKRTLHRAVLKDGNGGEEAAHGDLHHRALKCAYRQGLPQDGNGAFAGGKQKCSLLLAGESPGKQSTCLLVLQHLREANVSFVWFQRKPQRSKLRVCKQLSLNHPIASPSMCSNENRTGPTHRCTTPHIKFGVESFIASQCFL